MTSLFAELWVDREDAISEANNRLLKKIISEEEHFLILDFIRNGYVVLSNVINHQLIDNYLEEFEFSRKAGHMLASVPTYGPQDKAIIPAVDCKRFTPLTKYLDTYMVTASAKDIALNARIVRFLKIIFDDNPLAFQGLHFDVGSTQALHQDTAYVVSEKPLALAASWVALEDVEEGSGELCYYEGSHKIPDTLYSEKFKHFNHERDNHSEHLAHLEFLKSEPKRRGLKFRKFLPKKGDVLIWAADLVHGGSAITNRDLTRRSLVTHYCPHKLNPHYFNYLPESKRVKKMIGNDAYISTFYY